jgi:uncharacterized membrane protein
MNWFYVAIISPALWAIVNHTDKYLLSKYFKGGGIGSLAIFSSLIGVFASPLIAIFYPAVFNIHLSHAILIILNGFLYVVGLLPYMYALHKDETSVVVPLFQTIPVFSYILAFYTLGETLTTIQIIACLLVIIGAITLSFDFQQKRPKFKMEVFGLMFLASFSVALNSLIFKFVTLNADFWTTSFWEYIGFTLTAIFLLTCIKSYRNQFLSSLKFNKMPILGLNILNEIINIIAKFTLNYATILAPLAIVWTINGFQPLFVLLYGIILTIFFPKISKEGLARGQVMQKVLAIFLMFFGIHLLHNF